MQTLQDITAVPTPDGDVQPASTQARPIPDVDNFNYLQISEIPLNTPFASANHAPAALTLIASAALAACGGGGGGGGNTAPSGAVPNPITGNASYNYPAATTDEEAARFLQQAQFSSTAVEVANARAGDYTAWLQKQFAQPMSQTGWDWLELRGYGLDANAAKNVYNETIADFMVWKQLFSAPDAMRKRMALALSEFFVVSFVSMEIDWRGYTMTAYWDLLNKFAFGNFRDLLQEITLCPAMGYFLNTRGNQREDGKGRQPDENYAREVMQLFTIGLSELNLDGTEKLGADGKRIDTYDADDVSQLARVFTGYDVDKQYINKLYTTFPSLSYNIDLREYARQRMTLDATKHSTLAVSFLTTNIPAATPGAQALKTALDALFNHPNVGPFFGKQMIQRLVTSNPSPAYVARVATVFNNNGSGVRGDLKAVWAAILLDDEARGPQGLVNASFGKLREPMLRLVNWGRTFGLKSLANYWKLGDLSNSSYSLGQSPMRAPSVFNYFRPGYVPANTVMATQNAPAPEFQLVNETTVGNYINYIYNQIEKGIQVYAPNSPEVTYDSSTLLLDLVPDYSAELALVNNATSTPAEAARVAQSLVQRMNSLLCAGRMSAATQAEMQTGLAGGMVDRKTTATSVDQNGVPEKRRVVAAAIFMTMICPDYLIQK